MANSLTQATAPTLASILELHKDDIMYSLNCHQVGEIVSFDPSTQTAEVLIKMQRTVKGEIKDYPVLIDCPCVVLGGGAGRVTFPISAGDSCLVLFNDKDIDNWYDGGQKMPPRSQRLHSFSDAFALVGIHNRLNQISDYFASGVELKHGNSSIKLKDGYIDIKGNVNVVQNTVDDNSLHAYIISSYHNGASWYRVYSDKWCEQGGEIDVGPGTISTGTDVVFLKPFADTNYTITFLSSHADNSNNTVVVQYGNSYYGAAYLGSKTATGIKMRGKGTWYACGYIA